jgi:hypothetical protein
VFTGAQVRMLNKLGAQSLPWHPTVKSQEKTYVSARTGGNPADVQTRKPNTGLPMPLTTGREIGGADYRKPAVRKGTRGLTMLNMFLFLSVVSGSDLSC